MNQDLDRARAVAIDAALRAGAQIRAHIHFDKQVRHKGEIDLVTQVDIESERIITSRIREVFPDHDILAEEQSDGPYGAGSRARWIIDPLDGTTNFVHSIPHFAVSIALEVKGRLQLGVVYDPNRDELFEATRGRGAHLNGRPIRVTGVESLDKTVLGTGFPYDRHTYAHQYLPYLEAFMVRTQGIRRMGTASLDLAYVACGRLDGFWEFKLKPWDIAAGIVLVEEAGGRVSDRSGAPPALDGRNIVAAREDLLEAMLEVIRTLPDPLAHECL